MVEGVNECVSMVENVREPLPGVCLSGEGLLQSGERPISVTVCLNGMGKKL